jgi:predicted nucleic-acid-binding protein
MSIAVDTNVIVRLLTRDDEQQFSVVQRLLRQARTQQQSVMVALLVVLETEWVLRSRYRKTKDMIIQALTLLLESDDVTIEDEPTLEEALHLWKNHAADFADCLIAAKTARLGCSVLATFDAKASKLPRAKWLLGS